MPDKKPNKVLVIGLPKTGTSTLAVMLRMLGYLVTGPENKFNKGDTQYLENRFEQFNGFQDFPWCFEWERFMDLPNVKFIILQRDIESWWQSFWQSYGRKNEFYKSYSYMQITKSLKNKEKFLHFFNAYYEHALEYKKSNPDKFMITNVKTLKWEELCEFLDEPVPKGFFGKPVQKPHAKKQYSKTRQTFKYKLFSRVRDFLIPFVGINRWNYFIVFLRKNGLYL